MSTNNEEFEYVYVEIDGTVRELDKWEVAYLETEFKPTDGARPYIKRAYTQLTPDNKISGFLQRTKVPDQIKIVNTELRFIELKFPFSIYHSGRIIQLPVGIYSVKVLGGWGVSVGDFNFSLKGRESGKVIHPKVTNFRVQSYEYGERAKKIMTLDVPAYDHYFIQLNNQHDLKVRRSNFILSGLWEKQIPNKDLRICIG